jgi:hypothetical protein
MPLPYVLRFVQRFRPGDEAAFLALEARFAALERRRRDFPKGRRLRPYAGREPAHTLIWECQFPSLQAAQDGLDRISSSRDHARLLKRQVPYFLEAWTEIYEVLELGT